MKSTRSIISNALGALLVWDLYRDWTRIQDFCLWALIAHFLYFQLPLKSRSVEHSLQSSPILNLSNFTCLMLSSMTSCRALAFLHPVSFTGAIVIPALYIYTLIIYPSYEVERMNKWEMTWEATICRSCMFYLAPLVGHALDISAHQHNLIVSYQSKPEKGKRDIFRF